MDSGRHCRWFFKAGGFQCLQALPIGTSQKSFKHGSRYMMCTCHELCISNKQRLKSLSSAQTQECGLQRSFLRWPSASSPTTSLHSKARTRPEVLIIATGMSGMRTYKGPRSWSSIIWTQDQIICTWSDYKHHTNSFSCFGSTLSYLRQHSTASQ